MYELKKNGKVFTSKCFGTGTSSYKKKKKLPGRGLTKVEKHWSIAHIEMKSGPEFSHILAQVSKITCLSSECDL